MFSRYNIYFSILEEERKRFRALYDPTYLYSNVGFQYNEEEAAHYSGDEEYDPSACFENEKDEGEFVLCYNF